MKDKKKTVGKVAYELLNSVPDNATPIDQMRENLSDYESNMFTCCDAGKKEFEGDFFVVVLTKKERLMPNVLRNYFIRRKTCPTPEYDQAVYRYDRNDDALKFLWVIPARDICSTLMFDMLNIRDDERDLLKFTLEFKDGTLLRLSKRLNGEKVDSPFLEDPSSSL